MPPWRLAAPACAILFLLFAGMAAAQDGAVTVEQVTAEAIGGGGVVMLESGGADAVAPLLDAAPSDRIGAGQTFAVVRQSGQRNRATAFVLGSPGSVVEQAQSGQDNSSAVGIAGGFGNAVGVSQNGMGLSSGVLMLDSSRSVVGSIQTGVGKSGLTVVIGAENRTILTVQ